MTDRPNSLGDLFITLTVLALQGFGGVLAVVQSITRGVIGDRPLLFKVWEFPRLAWVSLCFGVTGYGSKSNGSGSPFFLGRPERPGWARLPIISVI